MKTGKKQIALNAIGGKMNADAIHAISKLLVAT
jgi:hypothetical protein